MMYYKIRYVFSENCSELTQKLMIGQYAKLRNVAVDLLNPRFEEWNKEYDRMINKPMSYEAYINIKQREILKTVNDSSKFSIIDLDVDDMCDIIARHKLRRNLTLHFELIPIDETEG